MRFIRTSVSCSISILHVAKRRLIASLASRTRHSAAITVVAVVCGDVVGTPSVDLRVRIRQLLASAKLHRKGSDLHQCHWQLDSYIGLEWVPDSGCFGVGDGRARAAETGRRICSGGPVGCMVTRDD
jgi:hypothetical protein